MTLTIDVINFCCYQVDTVGFFVKGIIRKIRLDRNYNDQTHRQANGQTKNVDERNGFVPFDIADGGDEVVSEHIAVLVNVKSLELISKKNSRPEKFNDVPK